MFNTDGSNSDTHNTYQSTLLPLQNGRQLSLNEREEGKHFLIFTACGNM